jgi:hypothetical protein
MTDNAAIVFHGFLNLSTLEKKSLVDAMNGFFDEIAERERIRWENEERFETLKQDTSAACTCCGSQLGI